MTIFLQAKPRLTAALAILAFGGATAFYLSKRHLEELCPRVPITQLERTSACRNLIESCKPAAGSPWGTEQSVLLSAWPSGSGGVDENHKTRWMTSFVALQVDVPVAQLGKYVVSGGDGQSRRGDAYDLSRSLFSAFLDARARGLEAWLLDKDDPPLSFAPGSLLFGRGSSMGAFMLGSWSSARGIPLKQPFLTPGTTHPVSEFPSNEQVITTGSSDKRGDAAGTVLYWTFPRCLVDLVNKVASYGLPWRLMDGGFQEFIVERISDETARVTYVTVEFGDAYPGGQTGRDFQKIPRVFYELHVVYAQILLWRTMKRLQQS
ncbi:hypothetical protein BDW75DRAFT_202951 [Aspergillus navahoensis]